MNPSVDQEDHRYVPSPQGTEHPPLCDGEESEVAVSLLFASDGKMTSEDTEQEILIWHCATLCYL